MRPTASFGGPLAPTSYPVAPGSLVPQATVPQQPLKRFVVLIPAGGIVPVVASGDFYYVESILAQPTYVAIVAPLTIKPDSAQIAAPLISYNQKVKFASSFSILQVQNPAGNADAKLTIWVGFGDYLAPINRSAALTSSFVTSSNAVVSAAAYAVRDAVCTGPMSMTGFFPQGVNGAKISRAQILSSSTNILNANFRIWFYGGDTSPAASVDHTTYNIDTSANNIIAPPLEFPSFIVSSTFGFGRIQCDIVGSDSIVYSAGSSNLFLQIQALAAYVPAVGQTFVVSLTAEYF